MIPTGMNEESSPWERSGILLTDGNFPEENTWVYHNLDSVIKKNYKSTFQILPSLSFSGKEKKNKQTKNQTTRKHPSARWPLCPEVCFNLG